MLVQAIVIQQFILRLTTQNSFDVSWINNYYLIKMRKENRKQNSPIAMCYVLCACAMPFLFLFTFFLLFLILVLFSQAKQTLFCYAIKQDNGRLFYLACMVWPFGIAEQRQWSVPCLVLFAFRHSMCATKSMKRMSSSYFFDVLRQYHYYR